MTVEFLADLHIHTCLSPCADLSMTPKGIVEKAASLGINIIAICDHNSVENVEVTIALGRSRGINVIAGMEICSSEEVHVLGLFGEMESALKMQDCVYEHLQPGENNEDLFGMQVVVNAEDEVMGFNPRLLIGSTDLSVNQVVELIQGFNGIAVASHIDREAFGIIGQLGFISPDLKFDALEISCHTGLEKAIQQFEQYRNIPWLYSSDAHFIEDVGKKVTKLCMNHSTFEELKLALRRANGRSIGY